MTTRSRALEEWRRESRKAWRRTRCRERGAVVHCVRTGERAEPLARRRGGAEGAQAGAVRRFLIQALILLGCIAWLVSLLAR